MTDLREEVAQIIAGTLNPSNTAYSKADAVLALLAHSIPERGEATGWTKVTDRLPRYGEGVRVVIYTEGYDFAGEQFFHISADALTECGWEDLPAHKDREVAACASHWIYDHDLTALLSTPAPEGERRGNIYTHAHDPHDESRNRHEEDPTPAPEGELPVIPQGIKRWSIGLYSATFYLADGSETVVPLPVYRIWEAGFQAGVFAAPAPVRGGDMCPPSMPEASPRESGVSGQQQAAMGDE